MPTELQHPKQVPKMIWVERISWLLDSQFRFPGTNFRFGIDPIIGLIPILGDVSSLAISAVLLTTMARNGVSRKLLLLMVGNLVIDTVLGSIPIIGSIFDFTFKANKRNIKLLSQHYGEGKHQGSGLGIVILVVLALLVLVLAIGYLSWKLMSFLVGLF